VLILGLPEDLFWYADWSFVKSVAERKGAYDAWLAGEQNHLIEKH